MTDVPQSRIARVGKFGAVGIINTLLDFTIYNILFGVFGVWVILANLISTTIAMVFSFFANRNLVFKATTGSKTRQAWLFILMTAIGLYIIQLGTIHILTSVWTAPLDAVVKLVNAMGLGAVFPERFIRNNTAKALGTILSLAWNYVTYKRVVFR